MTPPPNRPSASSQVTKVPNQRQTALGRPLTPPKGLPLPTGLDAETLRRLQFAGIVFAASSGLVTLVAASFLIHAQIWTGFITLIPAAVLGGMAWQCLRHWR